MKLNNISWPGSWNITQVTPLVLKTELREKYTEKARAGEIEDDRVGERKVEKDRHKKILKR